MLSKFNVDVRAFLCILEEEDNTCSLCSRPIIIRTVVGLVIETTGILNTHYSVVWPLIVLHMDVGSAVDSSGH